MLRLISLVLTMLFVPLTSYADDVSCSLFGAEYVPQNQKIEKSFDKNHSLTNKTLRFVLRPEKGDMTGPDRSIFLYFDAYGPSGEKVSSMRLGNSSSNGIPITGFGSASGMFCTFGKNNETDCEELSRSFGFIPSYVNDDFSEGFLSSRVNAPKLIILQDTYHQLTYNSYNQEEDWDKYIKFYTEDRVYPDFRFYDFWIRTKCGKLNSKENNARDN